MRTKTLKGIILASAIFFVNCSDDATTAPGINETQSTLSSASIDGGTDLSSASVTDLNNPNAPSSASGGGNILTEPNKPSDPWSDPCVASSLPDACGPGTNPLPTSSADVQNPASSADVANPTSAGDVAPVDTVPAVSSSASVAPPASSAEVQKPSSSAGTPASSAVAPASSSSEKKVESSSSEAPKEIFLASGKEEEKDLMKVVYKTNTGWDRGGILAYPEQLSSTQKHGVVVWGRVAARNRALTKA